MKQQGCLGIYSECGVVGAAKKGIFEIKVVKGDTEKVWKELQLYIR